MLGRTGKGYVDVAQAAANADKKCENIQAIIGEEFRSTISFVQQVIAAHRELEEDDSPEAMEDDADEEVEIEALFVKLLRSLEDLEAALAAKSSVGKLMRFLSSNRIRRELEQLCSNLLGTAQDLREKNLLRRKGRESRRAMKKFGEGEDAEGEKNGSASSGGVKGKGKKSVSFNQAVPQTQLAATPSTTSQSWSAAAATASSKTSTGSKSPSPELRTRIATIITEPGTVEIVSSGSSGKSETGNTEQGKETAAEAQQGKSGRPRRPAYDAGTYVVELLIRDREGQKFWEQNFGADNLMVPWDRFITALGQSVFSAKKEQAQLALRYVLDNCSTGHVTQYKFAEFLKGFGPFKECIHKMTRVLTSTWFHGFLSSQEADRLLEGQRQGVFLIRFSQSKPGNFALAFVVEAASEQKPAEIRHTMITCAAPYGFRIQEHGGNDSQVGGRAFSDLDELIKHYSHVLMCPFSSSLSKENTFYGDLASDEAGALLAGKPDGTYLFRFSSRAGYLAVSYMDQGAVRHQLIQWNTEGYKFVDEAAPHLHRVHKTLSELAKAYSSTFVHPCVNLTFDVVEVVDELFASNKEKEQAVNIKGSVLVRVDNIMSDIFGDEEQPSTSTTPRGRSGNKPIEPKKTDLEPVHKPQSPKEKTKYGAITLPPHVVQGKPAPSQATVDHGQYGSLSKDRQASFSDGSSPNQGTTIGGPRPGKAHDRGGEHPQPVGRVGASHTVSRPIPAAPSNRPGSPKPAPSSQETSSSTSSSSTSSSSSSSTKSKTGSGERNISKTGSGERSISNTGSGERTLKKKGSKGKDVGGASSEATPSTTAGAAAATATTTATKSKGKTKGAVEERRAKRRSLKDLLPVKVSKDD